MQKNSVNKVILVGRLGSDVELKYTNSQMAVTNISVATTQVNKEKVETTEWSKVVVFGKTAEFASNYLGKGSLVYVEGRLQTRKWENNGTDVYVTEVIADVVTALGSPNRGEEKAGNPFGQE